MSVSSSLLYKQFDYVVNDVDNIALLKYMQNKITEKIQTVKTQSIDISQYISEPKDFLGDSGIENLENEVSGIIQSKFSSNNISEDKVHSFYVGVSPDPIKKPAVDLADTPIIASMIALINGKSQSQSEFSINSCLVNFFPSKSASIRPHADNEFYIDDRVPIHVITLGDERVVNFSRIYGPNVDEIVASFTPKIGTIYSMLPGCQDLLWHAVPPAIDGNSNQESSRVSLSFRRITPISDCNISCPVSNTASKNKLYYRDKPKSATQFKFKPTHDKQAVSSVKVDSNASDTVLILGSSITHDLNADKLVNKWNKNSINCVQLSVRGAKMVNMVNEAKNFNLKNPDLSVENYFSTRNERY